MRGCTACVALLLLVDAASQRPDIRALERAAEASPNDAFAHAELASALAEAGDVARAAESFATAATLRPDDTQLLFNAGYASLQLQKMDAARGWFEAVVARASAKPILKQARLKLAQIERDAVRPERVLEHLEAAIAIEPQDPGPYGYLGETLNNLKRFADAVEAYGKGLERLPPAKAIPTLQVPEQQRAQLAAKRGELHRNIADTLSNTKANVDALKHYRAAVRVAPDDGDARQGLWASSLELASWRGLRALRDGAARAANATLHAGRPSAMSPYRALFAALPLAEHDAVSRSWARRLAADELRASGRPSLERHDATRARLRREPPAPALRVTYLSRRFERYPGTQLMLRVFGAHNRSRVRVSAAAHGADDGSSERAIVRASVDEFVDVHGLPPKDAAARIGEAHVLVDYDGLHDYNNMALLARRAAPVQVTWLGYAATSGAGRRGRDGADAPVDFLVADRVIVPPEHLAARYYSESVLYLPGSYQPQDEFQGADGPRAFPPPPPFPRERDEEGIPRSAFVLGCLQRTNKLDPDAFDDWMNALRMAPRAVLWLLSGHEDDAERNLRAEAAARGVNPRRLHFASRVDKAGYLERLARVDLFLDTRPYGAHTTAADAMWTTTPVLTMLPETRSGFASRVGASLVEATGLSGVLLAGGRGAYSATAARLARSPAVAHALRRRVGEVRGRGLFDSTAFAAKLERAWRCAWDAKGAGGKERHVVVGGGLATV